MYERGVVELIQGYFDSAGVRLNQQVESWQKVSNDEVVLVMKELLCLLE